MRKTIIFIFLWAVFCILSNLVFAQTAGGNLTVWSYTDEVEEMVENYFRRANPNITVNYTFISLEKFRTRLDPVVVTERRAPDVFTLEAAFVREYVESGLLLDLTDIYEANRNKLMAYPAEIGTYNGRVYAMSWQVCPGAFFYRRSIARKYFGNDDPAFIQSLVSDFDRFLSTAERLRAASDGQAVILASRGDLFNVFNDSRSQPWIVNNRLVIDPVMIQYMTMSKLFHERGYDGKVGQWSDGWFRAMTDEHFFTANKHYEAFGYFLPTWGLHYVLKNNAEATAGDWAIVQGPAAYRWGGTWLAARKGTPNEEAAKEFIRYLTTNDTFMEQYALDTGELVSNTNVINRIESSYSEPFLAGQNYYEAFARISRNVNGRLNQSTDQVINGIFIEAANRYVLGEMTLEEALDNFRAEVQFQLNIR